MAIAFSSAGAGNGTETNLAALKLTCPAVVSAGNILIAHVIHLNTTTTPTTPEGWTKLYPVATIAYLGSEEPYEGRAWVFGKIAAGTEGLTEIDFGTAGGTSGRYGRIYRFSGRESGTIGELVPGESFSNIGHETDPQMPTVTTTVTGALAVALVAQDDNNTIAAAEGATGGTWAEALAEYVSTTIGAQGCMCQLQTCTPTADPGTVTGGEAATQNDENSVIGFEIRPSKPPQKKTLEQGLESDASVALSVTHIHKVTLGQAAETEETVALSAIKPIKKTLTATGEEDALVELSWEIEVAEPIEKTLTPTDESDTAVGLSYVKPIYVSPVSAQEADSLVSLDWEIVSEAQELRPDKDLTVDGWGEAPLWEKLKDDNDATLVKAVLS